MSYQPFLISNYATGYDRELQPWLLPNDAFYELFDGYVYRGVTNKRDGYSGFANGTDGDYTESRIVNNIPDFATGQNNTGVVLAPINLPNVPISRGSVTVTDGTESHTDNGLGAFPTAAAGTINYTTGVITGFQFNAASGDPVLVGFDYFPGLPVMGIMNFYPTNNIRELIVADTRNINKYNPTTQRLVNVTHTTTYSTVTNKDFWSWVNYADASSNPRLLFTNGVDPIQQYTGTTVTDYVPTFADTPLSARQIFNYKDRLVLFYTREVATYYPKRIRISGTGANCDVFDNTAPGAGFIDIPDNTQFFGAAFNRDDLLFYTEGGTWNLKYTGNDVTPFTLQKIDGSRGSKATFAVISYLNRTMASSPRGLTICDGYQLDRMDNNIPDFAFNDISGRYFDRCFSAFLDEDRDVYMLYPSDGDDKPANVPADGSDRILITNFEEDNFAIYRIPLSCMGNFQSTSTILWQDLTAANGYANWDILAGQFGNWNAFPYDEGDPVTIGGGHKGEIWRLNNTESVDNPQPVRAITIIDQQRISVTTDWNNYEVGDVINFEAVLGMVEINNRQGAIESTPTPYNTFVVNFGDNFGGFTAYISGGIAAKTIELIATSKKLNPWVDSDKKVRCGWIYFYVSTASTTLKDDLGVNVPAFLQIKVLTNNNEGTNWSDPTFEYLVDCSPINNEQGGKKWVKIWINQVGQFLQFQMSNNQAGAQIKVHAMMPGFQPLGRLI